MSLAPTSYHTHALYSQYILCALPALHYCIISFAPVSLPSASATARRSLSNASDSRILRFPRSRSRSISCRLARSSPSISARLCTSPSPEVKT